MDPKLNRCFEARSSYVIASSILFSLTLASIWLLICSFQLLGNPFAAFKVLDFVLTSETIISHFNLNSQFLIDKECLFLTVHITVNLRRGSSSLQFILIF